MNQNIKQIKSKSALAAYLFKAHENWDPHKNERNETKFPVKYKKKRQNFIAKTHIGFVVL